MPALVEDHALLVDPWTLIAESKGLLMAETWSETQDRIAEGRRQRLTDVQREVLSILAGAEMLTTDLGRALSDGPLGHYPSGRRRWESPSECAQPHVAALVRKGFVSRVTRGVVNITPEGRERLDRP